MEGLFSNRENDELIELATFYIGEALCGMDILNVQEINKLMDMTCVPQAPTYVNGILNLRGQIVTIIDLGKKLGLSCTVKSDECRNIIVNSKGEYIGLLVDKISDVVKSYRNKLESPPANIGGVHGKYFESVFKTDNSLIGIIDIEEVLKAE